MYLERESKGTMNRIKILYREPRRPQPNRVVMGIALLHILLLVPVMYFLDSTWVKENVYDSSDSSMLETLTNLPAGFVFLLLSVIAPLWEETVFRLWMNLKFWSIPIFTTGATVIVLLNFSTSLALFLGVLVLILTLANIRAVKHHMDIHFKWWFYASAVLFGMAHLGNHQLEWGALLFTLPQVTIGIAIGFIRAQYGMLAGVITHGLWNGLIGIALVLPYIEGKWHEVHNDQIHVSWEAGELWTWNASTFYSSDSVHIENRLVEDVLKVMIARQHPGAIVEIQGNSFLKINMDAIGDMDSVVQYLIADFERELNIKVIHQFKDEKVYMLNEDVACEAEVVPGEAASMMRLMGLYPTADNANMLISLLENEYAVKFINGNLIDRRRALLLPSEGLDSALSALKVYNCIEIQEFPGRVERFVVQLPD